MGGLGFSEFWWLGIDGVGVQVQVQGSTGEDMQRFISIEDDAVEVDTAYYR
jgi:hypothetical protein